MKVIKRMFFLIMIVIIISVSLCGACSSNGQTNKEPAMDPEPKTNILQTEDAYLGQTPPGDTPVVFAPDIVSVTGKNTASLTFSPNGRECLFYIEAYPNSYTMFTKYRNGTWTKPVKAWFSETRATGEPMFSPDGSRIYFYSNEKDNAVGKVDLWYIERTGSSWSGLINPGSPVNSYSDEYHPCPVSDGSLYFTTNSGPIVKVDFADGQYGDRVILPAPINLSENPNGPSWGDPYVPPDESFMIFKSNRAGGYGGFDNYISFSNADGSWGDPINMGPEINTEVDETAGDISPDGKYLFFGRSGMIYWVRFDINAYYP